MLCEISNIFAQGNFFLTWAYLSILAFCLLIGASSIVFYHFYHKPNITFEKWQRKSNPKFPSVEKVRDEIVQMMKGLLMATFCPSMALWLAGRQQDDAFITSKAFCGLPEDYGWSYQIFSAFFIWIVTDFVEFFYHYLGHTIKNCWEVHKSHHVFFNPTPFAVIADEYVDQFFRALPLLAFPLLMPVNMDLLFIEYAVFFYGYGIVLHWGYEFDFIDAHNPVINTAYHHYLHHAKSVIYKPYHCGFFLKIWDQLFGSVYQGECICAKCDRAKGNRSREAFDKIVIPDYSVLLTLSFWLKPGTFGAKTASDKNDLIQKSGVAKHISAGLKIE